MKTHTVNKEINALITPKTNRELCRHVVAILHVHIQNIYTRTYTLTGTETRSSHWALTKHRGSRSHRQTQCRCARWCARVGAVLTSEACVRLCVRHCVYKSVWAILCSLLSLTLTLPLCFSLSPFCAYSVIHHFLLLLQLSFIFHPCLCLSAPEWQVAICLCLLSRQHAATANPLQIHSCQRPALWLTT